MIVVGNKHSKRTFFYEKGYDLGMQKLTNKKFITSKAMFSGQMDGKQYFIVKGSHNQELMTAGKK
ncbi:hypothetical protein CEN39_20145 [Fischerella thermalis CCMEE 5201]|nr:hypothetical protein CEN39_20145 [Fischerella thermalis CCMEE 5201]